VSGMCKMKDREGSEWGLRSPWSSERTPSFSVGSELDQLTKQGRPGSDSRRRHFSLLFHPSSTIPSPPRSPYPLPLLPIVST
jgi:hypothetical protein